jgi:hypothetical protein
VCTLPSHSNGVSENEGLEYKQIFKIIRNSAIIFKKSIGDAKNQQKRKRRDPEPMVPFTVAPFFYVGLKIATNWTKFEVKKGSILEHVF